jgi:hypothetical protein
MANRKPKQAKAKRTTPKPFRARMWTSTSNGKSISPFWLSYRKCEAKQIWGNEFPVLVTITPLAPLKGKRKA